MSYHIYSNDCDIEWITSKSMALQLQNHPEMVNCSLFDDGRSPLGKHVRHNRLILFL